MFLQLVHSLKLIIPEISLVMVQTCGLIVVLQEIVVEVVLEDWVLPAMVQMMMFFKMQQ